MGTTQLQQPAYPWLNIYAATKAEKVVDEIEKKAREKGFYVAAFVGPWVDSIPLNGEILIFAGNRILRNRKDIHEFLENSFPDKNQLH